VEDLAGVGPGRKQRVVAEGAGVAVAGALLVVAVDLDDGGVDVDGHGTVTWAGAGGPGVGEGLLADLVELAGVAEGERAQERPDRGRCQDAVAEHACGGATAQHVHIVDAVATDEHAVDQGQQLGAGVGAGRAAQVDQLVGGRLDAEPLSQGGR
jgi:hypothetical protein